MTLVHTRYSQNKDRQPSKRLLQHVIARLPGCAGQDADAVSAHTLVKLEDAPYLSKFLYRNVQMYGYVFHGMGLPKSWIDIEDPVVLLERNLCGHPLAGLL